MDYHRLPPTTIGYHGLFETYRGQFMDYRGLPWTTMCYHEVPCTTMDSLKTKWAIHGLPWNTMGYHGLFTNDYE